MAVFASVTSLTSQHLHHGARPLRPNYEHDNYAKILRHLNIGKLEKSMKCRWRHGHARANWASLLSDYADTYTHIHARTHARTHTHTHTSRQKRTLRHPSSVSFTFAPAIRNSQATALRKVHNRAPLTKRNTQSISTPPPRAALAVEVDPAPTPPKSPPARVKRLKLAGFFAEMNDQLTGGKERQTAGLTNCGRAAFRLRLSQSVHGRSDLEKFSSSSRECCSPFAPLW